MKEYQKIGIFTRPIDQGTSGSGSHLFYLVKNIIDLNDKFKIVLIHYEKNSSEIYNKSTSELIIPRNPLRALSKIKKENFDLLHFSPLTIYSPIHIKGPRKIATIHGAAPLFLPEQYSIAKVLHMKYVVPYYVRKMDYIFTVSKTSKDFIKNKFKVKNERIIETYNAVEPDFRIRKENELEMSNYKEIKPFVLHISNFSERKNPWTLLKSFKIVKEYFNDRVNMVIAGNGWSNDTVLNCISNLGINHNVFFTGFISKEEIVELLNLAEVFVFPSLYEGYGMPNLEAMACGCPVVTSDAFAIPEIVDDSALILEDKYDYNKLAQMIISVIEDYELKNELSKKGVDRVKKFSWIQSANKVLEIYEKLLY